jgi:hypothetical protein
MTAEFLRWLRSQLSYKRFRLLGRLLNARLLGLQAIAWRLIAASTLDTLVILNASDKNNDHGYTEHYTRLEGLHMLNGMPEGRPLTRSGAWAWCCVIKASTGAVKLLAPDLYLGNIASQSGAIWLGAVCPRLAVGGCTLGASHWKPPAAPRSLW